MAPPVHLHHTVPQTGRGGKGVGKGAGPLQQDIHVISSILPQPQAGMGQCVGGGVV